MKGRELKQGEWEGFYEKPSSLHYQTKSHHETWNTQDNGLWQALRANGDEYRKAHGIVDKEPQAIYYDDGKPIKIEKGMILQYEPEFPHIKRELVEVLSRIPMACGKVLVRGLATGVNRQVVLENLSETSKK